MTLISFEAWLKAVDRQPIDNSTAYSPQCTDLWRDYLMRVLGAPWGVGHAQSYAWQLWTMFDVDADRPGDWLRKVSAKSSALPGDGVIWGTGLVKPTGHVAVVMADLGDRLQVMNQNYDGHPYAEVSVITKRHVLGYLRPKTTKHDAPASSGTDEGFLMALNDVQQQEVRRGLVQDLPDGGSYFKLDALVNDQRRMERGILDALAVLARNDDEARKVIDALRAEQVEEDGIAQAVLAVVKGIAAGQQAQNVDISDEDTGRAIAESIATLPDAVAQAVLDSLHQRLAG